MSSDFLDRDATPTATAFIVEGPRAGDAIGEALRDAFAGDFGLPDDMMACLRRLDKFELRAAI